MELTDLLEESMEMMREEKERAASVPDAPGGMPGNDSAGEEWEENSPAGDRQEEDDFSGDDGSAWNGQEGDGPAEEEPEEDGSGGKGPKRTLLDRLIAQGTERRSRPVRTKDPFLEYEMAMKGNKMLSIIFQLADTDGNLIYRDAAGITFILPAEELRKSVIRYSGGSRIRFIGDRPIDANIKSIDRESREVHLVSAYSGKGTVNRLLKEIYELYRERQPLFGTEEYEHISLYGTIVAVSRNREYAHVDLLDMQLHGTLHVRHWSKGFDRTLPEGIEDTHEAMWFDVVNVRMKPGGQYDIWLSAKRHNEDPWEKIPDEYYEAGAVASVRCTEKPIGKNHWWGFMPAYPGIEVVGRYTKRYGESVVDVGVDYKCSISYINKEERKFIVAPVMTLASGSAASFMIHE